MSDEKRGPGRPSNTEREDALAAKISEGVASGVASALAKAQLSRDEAESVMRHSNKPYKPISDDQPTPDTYDLRAAADEKFRKNGHTMSNWKNAVSGDPLFWNCKCMTCGAHGYARWRTRVRTIEQLGGPEAKHGFTPQFGGRAAEKTEQQCMTRQSRADNQSYTARTPGSYGTVS